MTLFPAGRASPPKVRLDWVALAFWGMLMAGPVVAAGPPDWDGFIRVPAFSVGPGQWATCDKGASFVFTAAGTLPEQRCVRRRQLRVDSGGAARVLPLQGVLELHAEELSGYRLVAVGPLPALHQGLGVNTVDPASIFIAYRFEPR